MADKEKKEKRITHTTPIGEAGFCSLVTPSDKFNTDGVYSVKLILDKENGEKLITELLPEYESSLEEGKANYEELKPAVKAKNPFKENPFYEEELNEQTAEKTGRYVFNFKMRASGTNDKNEKWTRSPALFDAKAQPIKRTENLKIFGGSILKVSFEAIPYFKVAIGCGISLKMLAVQVLKASACERNASSFGFGEEEGYEDGCLDERGLTEDNIVTIGAEEESDF